MDTKNIVWIEKYRPKILESLVIDDKYKTFLTQISKEPEKIPHLLLYSSSAGTGKTSTAYLLCHLLGSDILTLNASSDRGIDIIREQVSNFTKNKSLKIGVKKAVILDEADGLTSQAQNSLRNLMEETINNAFFILTANHIEKIIEPLVSRCVNINFNLPPKDQIKNYLLQIIKIEEVKIDNIDYIINKYYPDIRRMVLHLQSIKQGIPVELLDQRGKNENLLKLISSGDYDNAKVKIMSDEINIKEFIDYLFIYITNSKLSFSKVGKLCEILCQMEKLINFNVKEKMVILSNLERIKQCLTLN